LARSAERAFLTQSAFSRSIAALEEAAAVRLFDRGPRFVQPTAAGLRVIARARQLLSSSADLAKELALLRSGDLGDISVGAGPYSSLILMTAPLKTLRNDHPSVRIRLEINHWRALLERLNDETLDFFVSDVRDLAPNDRYIHEPLCEVWGGLYCRAGHPLAAKRTLRLGDLAQARFASVNMPTSMRQRLGQVIASDAEGLLPVSFASDSVAMLREHCLHTDDLLPAPEQAFRDDLEAKRMRRLAVAELDALGRKSPLMSKYGLTRLRARTPTTACQILMDLLRQQAKAMNWDLTLQATRRPGPLG
jgi:DNA-binding transcriptional LysR family regulator